VSALAQSDVAGASQTWMLGEGDNKK
jgi:hypothetical protein